MIKIAAFFTLIFFTFHTLASGQISGSSAEAASPANSPRPLIIHIQDAHANPEAQKNIAQMIRVLHQYSGIDTVFIEAGIGKLDARFLRFTPDGELNKKIAARLTELGEMTYADLSLFDLGNEIEFLGIENPALYVPEIQALRSVLAHESEIDAYLKTQRKSLDRQLSRIWNKDFRDFLKKRLSQKYPPLAQRAVTDLEKECVGAVNDFLLLRDLLRLQLDRDGWEQIKKRKASVAKQANASYFATVQLPLSLPPKARKGEGLRVRVLFGA
ncbi:MAG: hypothetical protein HY586_02015, partial [Candidatus Omnitrophica bacterium]|nr:hypothetical protein [Candidatus Omnitrophota bacterium]